MTQKDEGCADSWVQEGLGQGWGPQFCSRSETWARGRDEYILSGACQVQESGASRLSELD